MEVTTYDDPESLWKEAVENGWEGIILKDPDSSYSGERTSEWRKCKAWAEGEYTVHGWETSTENEDERDGFVVHIHPEGAEEEQNLAVQPEDARDEIRTGSVDTVEVQYLEKSNTSGHLRKLSFKRVVD